VTALARLAANIKCGLMPRQDVLYDRKPKSGAAGFTRAAPVHAIEAFGEPRDMFGRYPDSCVLYCEFRSVRAGTPNELYLAAVGRVTNGVADKITECAGNLAFSTKYIEAALRFEHDAVMSSAQGAGFGAREVPEQL